MTPLLQLASDRKEHSLRKTYERLADHFELPPEERTELLPSGRQETYKNRIGGARTYLSKAGLQKNTRRGHFRITDRGLDELRHHANDISSAYLKKFEEFAAFQAPKQENHQKTKTTPPNYPSPTSDATPEEKIESGITEFNSQLAADILNALHEASPTFFERVVVELLVAMEYGGSRKEAGKVVGRSGDGGTNGIIKKDRLGLDTIYLQARRWESTVSRPEIQKFVGALQSHRAHKGVFITTSRYLAEAIAFAEQIQNKSVLIDGEQLAQLMIEHDIGVSTVSSYSVKRIDTDYFLEE